MLTTSENGYDQNQPSGQLMAVDAGLPAIAMDLQKTETITTCNTCKYNVFTPRVKGGFNNC